MRYCKIDISRPFLQRLKFWFCGGVILVSADFEMSLVHAQGRRKMKTRPPYEMALPRLGWPRLA